MKDPRDKNKIEKPLDSRNASVHNKELRRAGGQRVANNEDSLTAGKRGHIRSEEHTSKIFGYLKNMPTLIEKLSQKEGCMPRAGELGENLL